VRDAAVLATTLREAGHSDCHLLGFEARDHPFKRSSEAEPTGLEYLTKRPIAPEFLDALADWLNAHLRGADD